MWKGWQGDLTAAVTGLVLFVLCFYAIAGAVIVYKSNTCGEECEERDAWRLYPDM